MNTMNMPGFTAEDSLYKTSWHYTIAKVTERAGRGTIRLAQLPASECKLCRKNCRLFCPPRFPECVLSCEQVNCFEACGGIP
jgi:hypothetical protein